MMSQFQFIDRKLFIVLFLSFIAATIIGTLSHEFGHYIVAKHLGYEARIRYAATSWRSPDGPVSEDNQVAILLGGPLQTILTGSIGLLFLWVFRKRFCESVKLSFGQWLAIFVALFWLRQTANFCVWLSSYFLDGQFSQRSDEIRIAKYFKLPDWSITSITAFIGVMVLVIVIFRFIPSSQRITFLTAGFMGGIAGYYLWIVQFGQYIMP